MYFIHFVNNILNEPKLILLRTVKSFQIMPCITNSSIKHLSFVYSQLNDQTVLFQTIQFSISHLIIRKVPIKCNHSLQSGPGKNGNKGVLYIPQNSRIGTLSSDSLGSHQRHSFAGSSLSLRHSRLLFSHFYYNFLCVFHTSDRRWSFTGVSDSKSPQVFKTLLSILAGLNNALVWMVSALPPIYNSSVPLPKSFGYECFLGTM